MTLGGQGEVTRPPKDPSSLRGEEGGGLNTGMFLFLSSIWPIACILKYFYLSNYMNKKIIIFPILIMKDLGQQSKTKFIQFQLKSKEI